MNLVKSYDYFQPEKCRSRIHIIGCGAVGSTVAENLVRMGLTRITLYDFDKVESKNIANQMFRECDIGKEKVDAVAEQLKLINPEIERELVIERNGYSDQKLDGYVILCVDNIDLRREIATKNKTNPNIKAMFDFRRVFAQGNQDCGFFSYGTVENWFFDAGSKVDGLFIDEWLEQNLGFDLDRNTMEELL